MASIADFWFIPFMSILIAPVSALCNSTISCPCGSSDKTYTLCTDDVRDEDIPCNVWMHCRTCQENQTQCATCPENRTGPNCLEDLCARLESPKPGSMSCRTLNNFKSCTGRCVPGYSFKDSAQEKITLACRRGTWTPSPTFPPCISGGHCDLIIRPLYNGRYNCSTGMDGTRCDVFCSSRYQGRYHCFYGRGWKPSLPYCTRPKEVNSGQRTPRCPCQNNGVCSLSGKCDCRKGWTGTNCEKREREPICPDPGIPIDGERVTGDGTPALVPSIFRVGQSLVFSCMDRDAALRGVSRIQCRNDGTWSAPIPQCVRDPLITCPSPKIVSNANLVNADDYSQSTLDQVYTPGQSVIYSCRDGYRLLGNSMITCLRTGQWSMNEPRCIRIRMPPDNEKRTCREPNPDLNGFIEDDPLLGSPGMSWYPPGSQLTFRCREGYRPVGPIMLYCLRTGDWSSLPPRCQANREDNGNSQSQNCLNRGPVENGRFVVSESAEDDEPDEDDPEFLPDTRLYYMCEKRYILIGSNTLTCLREGYWNTDPPVCVEDCGRAHLQTTHKITNGSSTEAGDWPWMVAVAATKRNYTEIICGGALINNRTVLTAAHCLTGYPFFTLYFGKYYRDLNKDDDKVETRRTTQIIIHPEFNITTYENDIALLSFEPSVVYSERIQPVCLPSPNSTEKNLIPKKVGSVTGWGYNELNLRSRELLVAHLPVQPDDECMDAYEEHGISGDIHKGMFCAGHTKGVVNTCRGDSGSPFVFLNGKTHRQTIEGVVSFGPTTKSCDSERVYTVFTKVAEYMPWILKTWNLIGT